MLAAGVYYPLTLVELIFGHGQKIDLDDNLIIHTGDLQNSRKSSAIYG